MYARDVTVIKWRQRITSHSMTSLYIRILIWSTFRLWYMYIVIMAPSMNEWPLVFSDSTNLYVYIYLWNILRIRRSRLLQSIFPQDLGSTWHSYKVNFGYKPRLDTKPLCSLYLMSLITEGVCIDFYYYDQENCFLYPMFLISEKMHWFLFLGPGKVFLHMRCPSIINEEICMDFHNWEQEKCFLYPLFLIIETKLHWF